MYLNIHILSVAGYSHTKRSGKGHDLMGTEAAAVADLHIRSADSFLEVAHYIQMSDEFHISCFSELNTDFHWSFPLVSKHTPPPKPMAPQPEHF